MSIIIRPYHLKDRASLRHICCSVANKGEPIDEYFPNEEITADLLTSYYTDYEPDATFVIEIDGKIIGYINGCLDNRRYGLITFFLIFPQLLLKASVQGIFMDKKILHTLTLMLKNWKRIVGWRKESFNSHCGHLHIGIAQEYRHQHFGEELIRNFMKLAGKRHIHLIFANVHSANRTACYFFESLGFIVHRRFPMVGIFQGQEERYDSLFYAKKLD